MIKDDKDLNILYSHRTRGRDVEGVHIRGISDAFRKMGHTVSFVSIPGVDVYEPVKASENKAGNRNLWTVISEYCPQVVFEIMELLYNVILYRNARKVLQKQRIDFIYERYALNTFATTLLGKRLGIPVIQEINDATGIRRVRQHRMEFIARWIESWVFNNSSSLITISSEFERILMQRGIPKGKVSFLPNAVNPETFNPEIYDDRVKKRFDLYDKVVVGFVGSFAVWHGVESILEVAPELINSIPNIHFLMVGSGLQLHNVQERVNTMGMEGRFTFPGKVPFNEVPLYLKAMDIGIIPKSNEYGSPMKLFEYMAMGVVPVVPLLPPITDVIEHGNTGLLFDCDNADDLRRQIHKACSDEAFRKHLSENARKMVLSNHLWIHNANHIVNRYRMIAREKEA